MTEDSMGATSLNVDQATDQLLQNLEKQSEAEEANLETEIPEDTQEDVEEIEAVEDADEEIEDQADDVDEDEVEDDEAGELHYEVDGEIVSATQLKEWRKSGMLEADYTRKSQENAELKKTLQAEFAQVQELQAKLQDALATVAIDPTPEPNWQELNEKLTPKEFNQIQLEWASKQQEKQRAAEAYQLIKQQSEQEVIQREQQAILEKFPTWAEPAVWQDAQAKIIAQAEAHGFSAQDVAGINDHRMFVVLNRLAEVEAQLAEVEKAKVTQGKRVAKAVSKLPAGSKKTKGQAQQKQRRLKQERFSKSRRSIDDALNMLLD